MLHRLIVFDVAHRDGGARDTEVIINPCITQAEGEYVHDEVACRWRTFPPRCGRHARVTVKGLDRKGKSISITGEGLLAVVLQHEVDHLDGILFIDRISRLKRGIYLRRLKNRRQPSESTAPGA